MGPRIIDRMWFTGVDTNDMLFFYFDGEETASCSTTFNSFFNNPRNGFCPLVAGPSMSSGT